MLIFGFYGTSKTFNIRNLWKIVLLTLDGGKKCFNSVERRVILFLTYFFQGYHLYFYLLDYVICFKFNVFFSPSTFLYEKAILSNKSSQSEGLIKRKKANGLIFSLFH